MTDGGAARPPVLVIGSHRSGTTLVARLLERLGVFMGARQDGHAEATLFRALNDGLLWQSGGEWDNPGPTDHLLANAEARRLVADHGRLVLRSPRSASFLGWRRYAEHREVATLAIPWGWKDPRTTFTLPIWLDLFPEAKVVHVKRHGVDVAQSLKVREERRLARVEGLYRRWRPLFVVKPAHKGFVRSARCTSLEGAFGLWEEYVDRGDAHARALGERALELRFEDVVQRPAEALASLGHFCELPAGGRTAAALSLEIDASRAFAYRASSSLTALARAFGDRLGTRGYAA